MVIQVISPQKCDKVVMDRVQPVSTISCSPYWCHQMSESIFSTLLAPGMYVACCKDCCSLKRWQKVDIAHHQPSLSVLPAAFLLALPLHLQHQAGGCPQPLAPGWSCSGHLLRPLSAKISTNIETFPAFPHLL